MTKTKTKKIISDTLEKTPKELKLFENVLKTVQQFVQGRSFTSLTYQEFLERLHIPEQHQKLLEEVLTSLTAKKMLILSLGRYSLQPSAPDEATITGIMHLHPRGFGFVKPNLPTNYEEDIFIPKHQTANAVDGDAVEVLVNTEVISEKGPEGRVTKVLTRARSHITGIVREIGRNGVPYAYAQMLGASQQITVEVDRKTTLKRGDRITMEVLEWGNKNSPTICNFTHLIGNISDPSCDIPAAIAEYELRNSFPKRVADDAIQFGTKVSLKEIAKREDLRNLTCFTIDPDTAKDYDDAVNLTQDSRGHYHLGVHIADVSHYVTKDSEIDIEAQLRCNSTYFPGICIPMLPRELSDNLCSLKPNVNRLTASVLMEFDPTGELCNYRITRSVIKSCKRFTYKEAKAVLDGLKVSQHAETLKMMVTLCGLLKRKRYERGSIEFGLPELVILVDEKGNPTKTDYVVYDITHQLVEEFMLKANETVATHLTQAGKHLTYRIHDEPAEENMKDFAVLASAFGFQLSPNPTPKEIQKLFDEAMSTPYGQHLATSYIRRMRLAVYSADNIGHYGLSLTHYCHFTSPIRRYVDLVVHRILFQEDNTKPILDKIAERCSQQERISAKAENSVVLLKKLRLLDKYQKEDPTKQYEAIVTRVKIFGIYFEIVELMLEGFLHVSELENDYFIFEEEAVALRGRHTGSAYTAGDTIRVMLTTVDLISQESKWNLIATPPKEITETKSSKKPKQCKTKPGTTKKSKKPKKTIKKQTRSKKLRN